MNMLLAIIMQAYGTAKHHAAAGPTLWYTIYLLVKNKVKPEHKNRIPNAIVVKSLKVQPLDEAHISLKARHVAAKTKGGLAEGADPDSPRAKKRSSTGAG